METARARRRRSPRRHAVRAGILREGPSAPCVDACEPRNRAEVLRWAPRTLPSRSPGRADIARLSRHVTRVRTQAVGLSPRASYPAPTSHPSGSPSDPTERSAALQLAPVRGPAATLACRWAAGEGIPGSAAKRATPPPTRVRTSKVERRRALPQSASLAAVMTPDTPRKMMTPAARTAPRATVAGPTLPEAVMTRVARATTNQRVTTGRPVRTTPRDPKIPATMAKPARMNHPAARTSVAVPPGSGPARSAFALALAVVLCLAARGAGKTEIVGVPGLDLASKRPWNSGEARAHERAMARYPHLGP